jgi:hypothetical protein
MPFCDFRKEAGAGSLDQVLILFIGDFPNGEASTGCHFDLLFPDCRESRLRRYLSVKRTFRRHKLLLRRFRFWG